MKLKQLIVLDKAPPEYSGDVYKVLRKRVNLDGSETVRIRKLYRVSVTNTTSYPDTLTYTGGLRWT